MSRAFLVPLLCAVIAACLAIASLAIGGPRASADRDAGTHDAALEDPRELARRAVDPDPAVAEPAIAALRALGRDGHAALVAEHQPAIGALRETGRAADPDATDRLRRALDAVAAQRDAHASGLYWHTDLDAARAEAQRTGRPILSLRLLGRLDEEMSCANSRFFRAVLYPDARVAGLLSQRFVLHWSSERPAPRITIDLGDGRRIVRTITGNSVHYVLDPAGRVVDAIPGLYAPSQLVAALARSEAIVRACSGLADRAFTRCRAAEHSRELAEVRARYEERAPVAGLPGWEAMIAMTSRGRGAASAAAAPGAAAPEVEAPSAIDAMELTLGKANIETRMLRVMARDPSVIRELDPGSWRLAGIRDVGSVDPRTVALVRLKTGAADPATDAWQLVGIAAADGARNEATLHRTIHEWMVADEDVLHALPELNERVYRELFLTPADDPWLGLRDPDLWDVVETP